MRYAFVKAISLAAVAFAASFAPAQIVLLPDYFVQTVATGISQPTTMAFIGDNDFFICEKGSGRVKRYTNGAFVNIVLDLPVNASSERGLLGIATHPDFPTVPKVYLYYSRATSDGAAWIDNRVDRFDWNGTVLSLDIPIISFPMDASQSNGPNHDGGIILFGPDRKLYVITGDLNRSRVEQNTGTLVAGVGGIHRLEFDGSTPADNPFIGHADPRIRTMFAYGVRNSFGMAFDPLTGFLWDSENGPASYDEINLCRPGFNSGWLPIMGPDSRDPQGQGDLQFLPNSHYSDPEMSWLSPIAVTSLRFLSTHKFGPNERNQLLVGDNNTGQIYLFTMNAQRDAFVLTGGLADLVADNVAERDQVRIGTGFGVVTDIQLGPDGYAYLVNLISGSVLRIRPKVDPVRPFTYQRTAGTPVSGTLESLFESDDDRLVIGEFPPISVTSPSVEIVARGTSPVTTPLELTFSLETSTTAAPAASVPQVTSLFNFTNGQWEVVDTRPCTLADSFFDVLITTNPARFVNPADREMRARISFFDPGTLFTASWAIRFDKVGWKVKIQ